MPFTSGQILRSKEVRAFVDFLTEKFAPDSFRGMRSASSSAAGGLSKLQSSFEPFPHCSDAAATSLRSSADA